MKNKTVAFCTLGCKVNQYETNAMIQKFKENNYEIVEFQEKADIYIINTCTVTNMADRKSRQMLRKVKELNPKAILVAVGCYAQVAKEELEKIPEIDLILGNNQKKDIVEFIEQYQSKINSKKENSESNLEKDSVKTEELDKLNSNIALKQKQTSVTDVMHCEEYADFGDVTYTEKTRAVIKVQDGCDRFCSYCIIPFARGHIRSRNPESVISEITKIAQKGIKEVVITGIHLASYGRDFKQEDVQDVLKKKNKILGKEKNKVDNIKINANEINTEKMNTKETNSEKVNSDDINSSIKGNNNEKYRLIDLLEDINKIDGIERIRLRVFRANLNYRRIC